MWSMLPTMCMVPEMSWLWSGSAPAISWIESPCKQLPQKLSKAGTEYLPTSMTGLEKTKCWVLGFIVSFLHTRQTSISPVTPVQARPTSVHTWRLWNSEGSHIWSLLEEVQKSPSRVSICNTQNSLVRFCVQWKAPWVTTQVTCFLPALEGHW